MQTIKAYYDEGKFIPFHPVSIPNGSHVIITLLDMPASEVSSTDNSVAATNESREQWLMRLHEALDLSMDEELPDVYFQRSKDMRPPINLAD